MEAGCDLVAGTGKGLVTGSSPCAAGRRHDTDTQRARCAWVTMDPRAAGYDGQTPSTMPVGGERERSASPGRAGNHDRARRCDLRARRATGDETTIGLRRSCQHVGLRIAIRGRCDAVREILVELEAEAAPQEMKDAELGGRVRANGAQPMHRETADTVCQRRRLRVDERATTCPTGRSARGGGRARRERHRPASDRAQRGRR